MAKAIKSIKSEMENAYELLVGHAAANMKGAKVDTGLEEGSSGFYVVRVGRNHAWPAWPAVE